MEPQKAIDLLQQQPFELFRIHMTHGAVYEVRHPDLCIVTFTPLHVAVPNQQAEYAAKVAKHDLIVVDRLETIR